MRVLVADDDYQIVSLLKRFLTSWGHQVWIANDGVEALNIAEDRLDLQIMLLDWMMPRLEGLDVCRRVRSMFRQGPVPYVILVTGRSSKEDFLEGMSSGADDFIAKPVDANELRVRIYVAERMVLMRAQLEAQAAIRKELSELSGLKLFEIVSQLKELCQTQDTARISALLEPLIEAHERIESILNTASENEAATHAPGAFAMQP